MEIVFPGRFCVMFHHAGTRPLLSGSVGNIKGCMHLVCNYLLMGCQDSKLLSKALFFHKMWFTSPVRRFNVVAAWCMFRCGLVYSFRNWSLLEFFQISVTQTNVGLNKHTKAWLDKIWGTDRILVPALLTWVSRNISALRADIPLKLQLKAHHSN